MKISASATNKP